jgi:hypothetical protein
MFGCIVIEIGFKSNEYAYFYVRIDEHLHGLFHVLLKLGMKSVERAVDGNGCILCIYVV